MAEKKYFCNKHGIIDCDISFKFKDIKYKKSFCLKCLADLLENKLGEIYKIKDKVTEIKLKKIFNKRELK